MVRRRGLLLALMAWMTAVAASSVAAEFHAQRIESGHIDSLPRAGPDAIAGLGDWWLSDGELCAAISAIGHDGGIIAGGGALVDFGYCDRADDQWAYANVLAGLAKEQAIPAQRISAHRETERAEITVVGEDQGLRQTLRYVLSDEHPGELALWIEVERLAKGRAVQLSGLLTLYPNRALTPFSFSSFSPGHSLGFDHPYIDRENLFSLVRGMMPADWNILVGSHGESPSISYGVQLKSAYLTDIKGEDQRLPQFLLTLPHYSLHGWMSRPLWIKREKLGLLQMAQSQLMDLKVGERLRVHFRLVPGQRGDVAAVTDKLYRGPVLRGAVSAAPVVVDVRGVDGRTLSQRRIERPGSFSLRLPAGQRDVVVLARSPWGETLERAVTLAGDRDIGRLQFRQRSELRLPRGEVMTLTFLGLDNTPTPRLRDDLLEFRRAGEPVPHTLESNTVALAGIDSDPASIFLPPGRYRVWASRGLEYGVETTELSIGAGEIARLDIAAPVRELHSDWLSADLHVHAGGSFDSALPLAERLRSFAAQDADVLVLSEHNRIVDASALARELGLADRLTVLAGAELTGMARTPEAPTTLGHSNIFPLVYRPDLHAGGAPRVEARRLRALIAETRYRYPDAVFQLNHPRSTDPLDADTAFFDHLSLGTRFEPWLPLSHARNRSLLDPDPRTGFRDIDFDAIEVMNGGEMETYERTRRDWFALLNQGLRVTATGNSDSHGLGGVVAVPRNYIGLPAGEVFSESNFAEAIRRGRLYLSSGPLLELTLGAAGPGETVRGSHHSLSVVPRAASWVGLDTLRIYLNGRLWRERKNIVSGESYSENIHVARDSVLVVELSGPVTPRYEAVLPGLRPLALSNPIYIDADGDKRWQSPGFTGQ